MSRNLSRWYIEVERERKKEISSSVYLTLCKQISMNELKQTIPAHYFLRRSFFLIIFLSSDNDECNRTKQKIRMDSL